MPSTPLFSLLLRLNNRRLAKDIKPALKALGFEEFTLINDKDIFRRVSLCRNTCSPTKPCTWTATTPWGCPTGGGTAKAGARALMRKANVVFCNSRAFTERARRYNPNSFYIGNGFDASQFHQRI